MLIISNWFQLIQTLLTGNKIQEEFDCGNVTKLKIIFKVNLTLLDNKRFCK